MDSLEKRIFTFGCFCFILTVEDKLEKTKGKTVYKADVYESKKQQKKDISRRRIQKKKVFGNRFENIAIIKMFNFDTCIISGFSFVEW